MPTSFTTRKLQRYLGNHYGDSVVIQSQQGQGKSNIIKSSNITLGDAIKAASNLKAELKWSNEKRTSRMYNEQTDDQLLYSVASIIRRDIDKVRFFKEHYPTSTEVSFENSLQLMPDSLVKLLSWITDEKVFSTCTVPSNVKTERVRKSLALTECIVATSRSILTPLHLGLAIQVYHKFGSKRLIEILNAHGFCVTYIELRRYLTSVANHEISRSSGDRYIPGAGVYDYGSERIKRGIERSLAIDDTTASLTDAIPYLKPKCRSEPPRRSDAFDKLQLCDHNKSNDVDQIWVFSRLLSRDVIEFPIEIKANEQKIPFWTGYNCLLSKKGADVTVVAYPPIIDSKPNDMATVYTAMKKCLDMSSEAGQDFAIQTFDQQLYAIAQQVKWSKPDIFNRHILRLGGFHAQLVVFLSLCRETLGRWRSSRFVGGFWCVCWKYS
ncbi:unnamed protein product [Mytilus coruscus]|uniref:Uncharacterized protein n=1 Tax=Mytilus coruscus TaxID=42192 RepID=A0A6J8EI42_MYTCO|nr:unnamed protein product [Mytilus coruscus]